MIQALTYHDVEVFFIGVIAGIAVCLLVWFFWHMVKIELAE